jgi:uncharacterized protein (TIGR02246 family)
MGILATCQRGARDTRAADERAIRNLEAEWLNAVQAKDVERTVSYWADDAAVLPPGAPPVTGKAQIRKMVSEHFALPGFVLSWQTSGVEVSRSGDLAYTMGTNEFRMNDAKGNPFSERGKYVTVWRKQPDGTWKCIMDIWNSSPPPATAFTR